MWSGRRNIRLTGVAGTQNLPLPLQHHAQIRMVTYKSYSTTSGIARFSTGIIMPDSYSGTPLYASFLLPYVKYEVPSYPHLTSMPPSLSLDTFEPGGSPKEQQVPLNF